MPKVELGEKLGIAAVRVTSALTGARVVVNEPPLIYLDAAQEEIHLRHGKIISIGFDSNGFPLGKKITVRRQNSIE